MQFTETEFDTEPHITKGDAAAATTWIEASALPENEKASLLRFVTRFPSLTFFKEEKALLDFYEESDRVTLPSWFREVRSTLAYVQCDSVTGDFGEMVRVDRFQWDKSPRSENAEEIWYSIGPSYINEEIRETLFEGAHVYLIGGRFDSDHSCLAVDLENPADRRILEFSMGDLLDDENAGRPLRGSISPIFHSYADLLGHVVAVRLPDGSVIEARS